MILTQSVVKSHPEHAKSGFIALATLAGSASAMRLLTQQKDRADSDIKESVQIAINTANAECLAILLDTGVNTSGVFGGKNLYHALYTFGSANTFGKQGYARLPEVTKVLADRKHDVNSHEAGNTFPLYSLIQNAICVHNYVWTQYYLDCMKILVKGGADPNFNEITFERSLQKKGVKTSVGRPAFSSALHCLMETVEMYAETFDSKGLAAKFVMECVEIICLQNTNLNHVRQIAEKGSNLTGSVLHQFAKSSVTIGVDPTIFKYLLRQGADINSQVKGKFFLNVYIDRLFMKINEVSRHISQPDRTSDVKEMLELSKKMEHNAIVKMLAVFKKEYANNPTPQMSKYITLITSELVRVTKNVRSLRRLVSEHLWILCKRNAKNVHQLPISVKYKTDILPV